MILTIIHYFRSAKTNLFCMKLYLLILWGILAHGLLVAQRIVFTPQWLPQAQFAGYYVAQEKGFYTEEGLEVEFSHPSASYSAFNRMVDGNSHIVTLQLLQAMEAIDRGFPLVNILQTSQHNSLLIVPRNDSICTLDDLRRKRVGIWKVGFGEPALILDRQMGLDIEWIQYLQGINLLVSGAVDATLAMRYNEYWLIMASGIQPRQVFAVADYGLDIPEDGLYVLQNFYKAHPEQVRAFARASRRGWEWTMEHPEEALKIVLKVMKQAKVPVNVHHQRWMLQEVLKLAGDRKVDPVSTRQLKTEITFQGKASFRLKPEQLELANDILVKEGLIQTPVDYHQFWKGEEK